MPVPTGSVFILRETSVTLTQQQIRAAARRVLEACIWMIERGGYGRLRILPYVSPSGCFYRVELHPEGKPSSPLFRYTTGDGHRYLANHGGNRVPWNAGRWVLAAYIEAGCADSALLATRGPLDPAYARWLAHMAFQVEQDRLPVAIADYEDLSRAWRLDCADGANRTIAVPPGYIEPGEDLEVEDRSA